MPSEVRIQGHKARKRFGQHFLIDPAVIEAIVSAIAPASHDCLVEVGPGLGALTQPLLERLGETGRLHGIEMDRDLVARLQACSSASLVLHAGDALRFDFAQIARAEGAHLRTCLQTATRGRQLGENGTQEPECIRKYMRIPSTARPQITASQSVCGQVLRIVGNVPYNISSPLLFHLLSYADKVIDQHLMLQREVAARIAALPGSAAYGRLSVMLQSRYAIELLFEVPPTAFTPPPAVHSAVLKMTPYARHTLPTLDWVRFAKLVKTAFAQRRKMLRNTLSAYQEQIDFDTLGFDLARRAQDVPVEEYMALAAAGAAPTA